MSSTTQRHPDGVPMTRHPSSRNRLLPTAVAPRSRCPPATRYPGSIPWLRLAAVSTAVGADGDLLTDGKSVTLCPPSPSRKARPCP